jgi:hypothetical protein
MNVVSNTQITSKYPSLRLRVVVCNDGTFVTF